MTEKQKYDWLLTWVNSCITDDQLDTCKESAREILNNESFLDISLKIETKRCLPDTIFNPLEFEQSK